MSTAQPRLLVLTQAVDTADPVLGFFHRWIEKMAAHAGRVLVVCLRKGQFALPKNTRVVSLGKENGASKIAYMMTFYQTIWNERENYDAVFVHMNAEYVVLGGLLWRLWGKQIVLWRNHKDGGLIIRLAVLLAHSVCYTSPNSFVSRYRKSIRMPVGIDTDAYTLPHAAEKGTLLSLGRFDPVKKMDVLLAAVALLSGEAHLDIYGSPTKGREMYLHDLKKRYASLEEKGTVRYRGDVKHADTPSVYASHDVFINLTPPGSFDKTLFEAMAAGCLVITSNDDLRSIIHPQLFVSSLDAQSVAAAIGNALALPELDATVERKRLRDYAQSHSLDNTIRNIMQRLTAGV